MKMINKTVDELFEKYKKLCNKISEESLEIFPREIIETIPDDAPGKRIYSRRWEFDVIKLPDGTLSIHCKYTNDTRTWTEFYVGNEKPGLNILFGATSGLEIFRHYHHKNPIENNKPVYYWNYDQISIKEIADFAAKIEHIKAMWTLVCINSEEIISRMKGE
ncbi:MAG: hypothetical protein IJT36_01645 [Alphaproteobacteria bacterium]|nr:hypothetical protein [Alphaproteobacteria bacterium]